MANFVAAGMRAIVCSKAGVAGAIVAPIIMPLQWVTTGITWLVLTLVEESRAKKGEKSIYIKDGKVQIWLTFLISFLANYVVWAILLIIARKVFCKVSGIIPGTGSMSSIGMALEKRAASALASQAARRLVSQTASAAAAAAARGGGVGGGNGVAAAATSNSSRMWAAARQMWNSPAAAQARANASASLQQSLAARAGGAAPVAPVAAPAAPMPATPVPVAPAPAPALAGGGAAADTPLSSWIDRRRGVSNESFLSQQQQQYSPFRRRMYA